MIRNGKNAAAFSVSPSGAFAIGRSCCSAAVAATTLSLLSATHGQGRTRPLRAPSHFLAERIHCLGAPPTVFSITGDLFSGATGVSFSAAFAAACLCRLLSASSSASTWSSIMENSSYAANRLITDWLVSPSMSRRRATAYYGSTLRSGSTRPALRPRLRVRGRRPA